MTYTDSPPVIAPDEAPPVVCGSDVLDRVRDYLGRFVAYPTDDAHIAHSLWVAHTHLMEVWYSTPRIAFLSPEPASGKSRALEVSEPLVPRPVQAVNVTPAYLFRKVGDQAGRPTILFDEIDTVFGPRAKADNEEIRGLLNAGHRRDAVAGRCVVHGKVVATEEIPAYSAVAMAGLGDLPDTILTRAVVIRMRRRSASEHVEPFRRRLHLDEGNAIRSALSAWADLVSDKADDYIPEMPVGIEDRYADVWEPLIAVADLASGWWSERARVAAVALVADSKVGTPSLGVRLLSDLRIVFGDEDVKSTEVILSALHNLEEAPWSDLRGKALNARGLAQRLGKYDIKSKSVRIGGTTPKGYAREDLADAWERYLVVPALEAATSATPQQPTSPLDGMR